MRSNKLPRDLFDMGAGAVEKMALMWAGKGNPASELTNAPLTNHTLEISSWYQHDYIIGGKSFNMNAHIGDWQLLKKHRFR